MASTPTAYTDEKYLDPALLSHWQAIKAELKAQGFDPVIASTWRDTAEQARLKAKGYSTVSFSFHNAVNAAGKPAAAAIDSYDRAGGYKGSRATAYFNALGTAAKKRGLTWGGDWKSFYDPGHIQLYPNSMKDDLQAFTEYSLAHPQETALRVAKSAAVYWLWSSAIGAAVLVGLIVRNRRKTRAVVSTSNPRRRRNRA